MSKILNASPGFGAPLSEQETKDFLNSKILNVHLGTVDENGHANIHPAWSLLRFFKGQDIRRNRKTIKENKQSEKERYDLFLHR